MKISCRIKKALNIKSSSPYIYCRLGLNPENKKKCHKCKHFEISRYTAHTSGQNFVKGLNKGIEQMSEFLKGMNQE